MLFKIHILFLKHNSISFLNRERLLYKRIDQGQPRMKKTEPVTSFQQLLCIWRTSLLNLTYNLVFIIISKLQNQLRKHQ